MPRFGQFLFCLVLGVALVIPGSAVAQTVPFAQLADHVKVGDVVSMTGPDGRRTNGKIAELTATSLTLLVNDVHRQAFAEAAVSKVAIRDSRKNGALIGLAGGVVPGAWLGTIMTTYCTNEATTCPAAPFVLGAVTGATGAAIGAGIDGLINRAVNVTPRRGAGVTVSPVIGASCCRFGSSDGLTGQPTT